MAFSATIIQQDDTVIVLALEGRLDVKAAHEAENIFQTAAQASTDVVLDMTELVYIASAGLRAIKTLYKSTKDSGHSLIVRNITEDVLEVFEITGFASMLKFEE